MGHILTCALSGRSFSAQELYQETFSLEHHLLWCCQCEMEYSFCFYSGAPLDIWKTDLLLQLFFCNVQLPLTNQQKMFRNHVLDANKVFKKRICPRTFIIFYLEWPWIWNSELASLMRLHLISTTLSFLIWILRIISPFRTSCDNGVVQHIWSFQHMAGGPQQWEWHSLYKAVEKRSKLVPIVAVRLKNNERQLSKHL